MSKIEDLTTYELRALALANKLEAENNANTREDRAEAFTMHRRCCAEIDRRANAIRDAENYFCAPRVQPGDQLPGGITATAEDIARARQLTDWEYQLEDLAS